MYLICGEALYDVFVDPIDVDVRRKVSLTAKAGGSPYNVAIGLARLGCPVTLATEIAGDTLGRQLEARLELEGVDRQFLRRTATATPLAMVDVDSSGTPHYAFYGLKDILFHPEPAAVEKQWTASRCCRRRCKTHVPLDRGNFLPHAAVHAAKEKYARK